GGAVELDGPKHDAVVREGDGGLVELLGAEHHVFQTAHPIEKAVLRVAMQVAELRHSGSQGAMADGWRRVVGGGSRDRWECTIGPPLREVELRVRELGRW